MDMARDFKNYQQTNTVDGPNIPSDLTGPRLRIAIGIATKGRAMILAKTLADVAQQRRMPDRVVVCCTSPEDVAGVGPDAISGGPPVEFLESEPGSCAQRNRIIDAAKNCDIIFFMDDDFIMEPAYLAATEQAFLADPHLVVSTGTVLADGINGKGLGIDEARAILSNNTLTSDARLRNRPVFSGYGCNMAIRAPVALAKGLRFDERLPLYAWQEDVGLSRALARHGAVVRLAAARGVHLGTKMGRGPGRKLGYSQMVNPIHLVQASGGTYPVHYALLRMVKNLLANAARSVTPEPWIDRRGRLSGNLLGLADLFRGRVDPGRALNL
ncbi:MAG: glycosyltransferase family A protein [Pseudomonadota bacterium]